MMQFQNNTTGDNEQLIQLLFQLYLLLDNEQNHPTIATVTTMENNLSNVATEHDNSPIFLSQDNNACNINTCNYFIQPHAHNINNNNNSCYQSTPRTILSFEHPKVNENSMGHIHQLGLEPQNVSAPCLQNNLIETLPSFSPSSPSTFTNLNFSFTNHTLESFKEEQLKIKQLPKRPRGRPRSKSNIDVSAATPKHKRTLSPINDCGKRERNTC